MMDKIHVFDILTQICCVGSVEQLQSFLNTIPSTELPFFFNHCNERGETLLFIAVFSCNWSIAKFLWTMPNIEKNINNVLGMNLIDLIMRTNSDPFFDIGKFKQDPHVEVAGILHQMHSQKYLNKTTKKSLNNIYIPNELLNIDTETIIKQIDNTKKTCNCYKNHCTENKKIDGDSFDNLGKKTDTQQNRIENTSVTILRENDNTTVMSNRKRGRPSKNDAIRKNCITQKCIVSKLAGQFKKQELVMLQRLLSDRTKRAQFLKDIYIETTKKKI